MLAILVASSKGGSGKSTLSAQLAAYFALAGKRSVLLDTDPQHSALRWAERRAALVEDVVALDGCRKGWRKRLPEDTQRLVIDSPAGSTPEQLAPFLEIADAVLVPVLPARVDLEAGLDFVQRLREDPGVRRNRPAAAVVGNRLRPWTTLSQQAVEELGRWPLPLVAELRDSQAYAVLHGLGRSMFDYGSQAVLAQQEDWDPLFTWLRDVNRARRGR
ncbi:ParA family protein [Pseudomarimonas salicorniae]|uniref:ParA family protein n=1 Tax=Pseudomarimonas salicorniae TaxID=2933270 RepID=A0ABT0GM90_9GAMM|nr:ParA family protein [Lysobacter sp. CAU 1642]MCK7595543.1 ParA family protein [Lysobacter sp. CAU 1642]